MTDSMVSCIDTRLPEWGDVAGSDPAQVAVLLNDAKAALLSLTRSAALEGKPKGIRVNAVLPGAIDTPMLWENPNIKSGREVIRPEDVGRAEDIAAIIAYLASDDAAFVQGAMVRADGGRLSRL